MNILRVLLILLIADCFTATAQNVVTIAGTGANTYNGDGIHAISANIGSGSIFVDNHGILYIADATNRRIRRIGTDGIISTIAGTGDYGYSGDGGPATNAKIGVVCGLFVTNSGEVYFTEAGNNTIRKIDTFGFVSKIAGQVGPASFNGDGILATSANVASPCAILVNSLGEIFFSDLGNHCIRKINRSGFISTVAGTPTVPGYSGDGGPATAAKLELPGFLSFGPGSKIYWTEWPNTIVRYLDTVTGTIGTLAGTGMIGNSGDGGPASLATFNHPTGICVDTAGNICVSDVGNHNIRRISSSGIISTIAGVGVMGYSGDNGPASAAMFNSPNCVIFDKYQNVYINDADNFRIRRINYNTNAIKVENISPFSVKIYQNPSHRLLTIVASISISSIKLYNTVGQEVLCQKPDKNETTINCENLSSGIYPIIINGIFWGKVML